MNEPQTTHNDDLRPLAGCDAASAPTRPGFTLRGRTWVYAAEHGLIGPWTPGNDRSHWRG